MSTLAELAAELEQFAAELAADVPLSRDRDSHMRACRQANIAATLAAKARQHAAAPPAAA